MNLKNVIVRIGGTDRWGMTEVTHESEIACRYPMPSERLPRGYKASLSQSHMAMTEDSPHFETASSVEVTEPIPTALAPFR